MIQAGALATTSSKSSNLPINRASADAGFNVRGMPGSLTQIGYNKHVYSWFDHNGDAAACLIRDGEIVAAMEKDRFSRIKHHIVSPYHAVR